MRRLNKTKLAKSLLLLFTTLTSANTAIVLAQDFIVPNKNVEVSGVPPIPVRLRKDLGTYQGMSGLPLAAWDDSKRRILLKGLSSVMWISDVDAPGKAPET